MCHSKKKTIALLLGLLFALLLFIPKQNAAASTKAANENIQWDPVTKTVTISGTVGANDIYNARIADGGWTDAVEHAVFLDGTNLIGDYSGKDTSDIWGMFGGYNPCANLKSVESGKVTLLDNPKTGVCNLYAAFFDCNNLASLDIHNWKYEGNNLALTLLVGTGYGQKSLSSLNLSGVKSSAFIDYGGKGFALKAAVSLSTLIATPSMFSRAATDQSFIDDTPDGTWVAKNAQTNETAQVSTPSEWKAFADKASASDTLYFYKPNSQTAYTFFANGGNWGTPSSVAENVDQHTNTPLSLPSKNPQNNGINFLGYARDPKATKAEVQPGQTENLPTVGLCANQWYAIWGDTPDPAPESEDGWHQSDAGWQYMVDGEYVTGWRWIDDSYGAHWYYFNEDTYMAASQWQWNEENSSWYWLCSSGPMICGLWQWIDNEWYGFWWNGKMCRGWVWDVDWQAWFYCYNNGIMARSAWVGRYWLNWRGIWIR